jgi:hypothetical protein
LKKTRPLWPPQRGLGLREPNLGKTNPCVSPLYSLAICFTPSRGLGFISNANPACSCVYIWKFQFRPIHPPSRRLSVVHRQSPAISNGKNQEITTNILSFSLKTEGGDFESGDSLIHTRWLIMKDTFASTSFYHSLAHGTIDISLG